MTDTSFPVPQVDQRLVWFKSSVRETIARNFLRIKDLCEDPFSAYLEEAPPDISVVTDMVAGAAVLEVSRTRSAAPGDTYSASTNQLLCGAGGGS